MSDYSDAELRERRLIHQLVQEALQRMGIAPDNPKSFDELVAGGELNAADCYVTSRELVTPGWLDRTP